PGHRQRRRLPRLRCLEEHDGAVDDGGRRLGCLDRWLRRGARLTPPRQHGSGVEREGRSGFYFACSARYLAALAWASESPCLPAACDASACFVRSFAASIIPMFRAFCFSSLAFMAMGAALASVLIVPFTAHAVIVED